MTTTAQRLAAHPRFRWIPGARDSKGWRVIEVAPDGVYALVAFGMESDWERVADMGPPDLSDPATIGCLVGMLREAWPHACVHPTWSLSGGPLGPVAGWRATRAYGEAKRFDADTEGEAVALALLAAWGET